MARTVNLISSDTTEGESLFNFFFNFIIFDQRKKYIFLIQFCKAVTPALYSGYLWRQSGQPHIQASNQKWVRRWFCLRPDHCLYFYKTDVVREND